MAEAIGLRASPSPEQSQSHVFHTVTEWLKLEWTSGDHLAQPLTQSSHSEQVAQVSS